MVKHRNFKIKEPIKFKFNNLNKLLTIIRVLNKNNDELLNGHIKFHGGCGTNHSQGTKGVKANKDVARTMKMILQP